MDTEMKAKKKRKENPDPIAQQPRIDGVKRVHGLLPEMDEEIRRLASVYHVSARWVQAYLMAKSMGKKGSRQPDFHLARRRRRS